MKTAKPGTWWVLEQMPGLFWSGQIMELPIGGEAQALPICVMDKAQAAQFPDRESAAFTKSMLGLTFVEPRELEFTS